MEKAQPQTEAKTSKEYNMTRKEALDIILEKCAKSKKQIRQGKCISFDEMKLLTKIQLKQLAANGAKE